MVCSEAISEHGLEPYIFPTSLARGKYASRYSTDRFDMR